MIRLKHLVFLAVSIALFGLSACSSIDKQSYDVTTIQSVGDALMSLADEKRQLGEYQEALIYYDESEKYALKRNDKYRFALSQLKRASIYLKLDQPEKTQQIIDDISQLERFEKVGLGNPLTFVMAQLAHHRGNTQAAVELLQKLQKNFHKNPEKRLYYQLVSWVYSPQSVEFSVIQKGYAELLTLKQQGLLYNIEVFSYAVSHYGQYLAENGMLEAENVLKEAIRHFSMLEQSNNIAKMYMLLADYHQQQNNPEQVEYYRQQAKRITDLKII